jgi:S1-C subfamily serine protease
VTVGGLVSLPTLQFRVASKAVDGVLSRRGFTVIDPKEARRAGLQVGDVILKVNAEPVNNVADVYKLYRRARRDRSRPVAVELERRGARYLKIYRFR